MAEQRSARKVEPSSPLLEALIELARSAIRTDREALERRAKITVERGGKAA